MSDFLIQRWLPNMPNMDKGAWVDEGLVKGLTATDDQKAIDTMSKQQALADPYLAIARRRAIRWDYVTEYQTGIGSPSSTVASKPKL